MGILFNRDKNKKAEDEFIQELRKEAQNHDQTHDSIQVEENTPGDEEAIDVKRNEWSNIETSVQHTPRSDEHVSMDVEKQNDAEMESIDVKRNEWSRIEASLLEEEFDKPQDFPQPAIVSNEHDHEEQRTFASQERERIQNEEVQSAQSISQVSEKELRKQERERVAQKQKEESDLIKAKKIEEKREAKLAMQRQREEARAEKLAKEQEKRAAELEELKRARMARLLERNSKYLNEEIEKTNKLEQLEILRKQRDQEKERRDREKLIAAEQSKQQKAQMENEKEARRQEQLLQKRQASMMLAAEREKLRKEKLAKQSQNPKALKKWMRQHQDANTYIELQNKVALKKEQIAKKEAAKKERFEKKIALRNAKKAEKEKAAIARIAQKAEMQEAKRLQLELKKAPQHQELAISNQDVTKTSTIISAVKMEIKPEEHNINLIEEKQVPLHQDVVVVNNPTVEKASPELKDVEMQRDDKARFEEAKLATIKAREAEKQASKAQKEADKLAHKQAKEKAKAEKIEAKENARKAKEAEKLVRMQEIEKAKAEKLAEKEKAEKARDAEKLAIQKAREEKEAAELAQKEAERKAKHEADEAARLEKLNQKQSKEAQEAKEIAWKQKEEERAKAIALKAQQKEDAKNALIEKKRLAEEKRLNDISAKQKLDDLRKEEKQKALKEAEHAEKEKAQAIEKHEKAKAKLDAKLEKEHQKHLIWEERQAAKAQAHSEKIARKEAAAKQREELKAQKAEQKAIAKQNDVVAKTQDVSPTNEYDTTIMGKYIIIKDDIEKKMAAKRAKLDAIKAQEAAKAAIVEVKPEVIAEQVMPIEIKKESKSGKETQALPIESFEIDSAKQAKLKAKQEAKERYLEKQREYQQKHLHGSKDKTLHVEAKSKTTMEAECKKTSIYNKPKFVAFMGQVVNLGHNAKEQEIIRAANLEKREKEQVLIKELALRMIASEKAKKEAQDKKLALAIAAVAQKAADHGVTITKGDSPEIIKQRIKDSIQAKKDAKQAILDAAKHSEKLTKAKEREYEFGQQELARRKAIIDGVEELSQAYVYWTVKQLPKYEGKTFDNKVIANEILSFNLKKYKMKSVVKTWFASRLSQSMARPSEVYKRERDMLLAQAILLELDGYTSTTHNKQIQKDIDLKLTQIRAEYEQLVLQTTREAQIIVAEAKVELDDKIAKLSKKCKRATTITNKKFTEQISAIDLNEMHEKYEKAKENREKLEEFAKRLR